MAAQCAVKAHLSGSGLQHKRPAISNRRAARLLVRAEDPKVVREYREDDDKVQNVSQPKYIYADEQPPPKPRDNMSKEMKQRLRQEYYGIGGAENVKATNWALYISIFVASLAILSALTGAL